MSSPLPPKVRMTNEEKHGLALCMAPYYRILFGQSGKKVVSEGTVYKVDMDLKKESWEAVRHDLLTRYPRLEALTTENMKVVWSRIRKRAQDAQYMGAPLTNLDRAILKVCKDRDPQEVSIPLAIIKQSTNCDGVPNTSRLSIEERLSLTACVAKFEDVLSSTLGDRVMYNGVEMYSSHVLKNNAWDQIHSMMVRLHPWIGRLPLQTLKADWTSIRGKAVRKLKEDKELNEVDRAVVTVVKPEILREKGIPLATIKDVSVGQSVTVVSVANRTPDGNEHLIFDFDNETEIKREEEEEIDVDEEELDPDDEEYHPGHDAPSSSNGSLIGVPHTSIVQNGLAQVRKNKNRNLPTLKRPISDDDLKQAEIGSRMLDTVLKMAKLDEYARENKRKIVFNPDFSITFRDQRKGEDLSITFPLFMTGNK